MDPFTELLVSNVLPQASPFRSPAKPTTRLVKGGQVASPDVMDESSMDIYGDIIEDVANQRQPLSSEERMANCGDDEMGDNSCGDQNEDQGMDLFTDVLTADLSEKDKMRARIKELETLSEKLKEENENLKATKVQLTKNISCLFMTSRNELQKKELENKQLRDTVRELEESRGHCLASSYIPSKTDKRTTDSKSHDQSTQIPFNEFQNKGHLHSLRSHEKESSTKDKSSPSRNERERTAHRGKETSEGWRLQSSRLETDGQTSRTSKEQSADQGRCRDGRKSDKGREDTHGPAKKPCLERSNSGGDRSNSSCLRHDLRSSHSSRLQDLSTNHSNPGGNGQMNELGLGGGRKGSSSKSTERNQKSEKKIKRGGQKSEGKMNQKSVQKTDKGGENINNKGGQKSEEKMNQKSEVKMDKDGRKSEEKTDRGGQKIKEKMDKDGRKSEEKTDRGGHKIKEKMDKDGRKSEEKTDKGGQKIKEKMDKGGQKSEEKTDKGGQKSKEKTDKEEKEQIAKGVEEGEDGTPLPGGNRMGGSHTDRTEVWCDSQLQQTERRCGRNEENVGEDMTLLGQSQKESAESNNSAQIEKSSVFDNRNERGKSLKSDESNRKGKSQGFLVDESLPSSKPVATSLADTVERDDVDMSRDVCAEASYCDTTDMTSQVKGVLHGELSQSVSNQTQGIELTSCVVSNQDWCSSPNASLPFSRVVPDCRMMDNNNTTNTQLSTNQTWPFENRAESSTVFSEDISISVGEIGSRSQRKTEKDISRVKKIKTCDRVRAFPISEIENGSNLPSNGILTARGGKCKPDSDPHAQESASTFSVTLDTNSGEASSKDSSHSKSTETFSNQSQKSSSKSETGSKDIDFHSPVKSVSLWARGLYEHEDNTNLTPPKLRFKQSTPGKSGRANVPSISTSTAIMCTPNLIVLGDEENTCATIISPFKSHSIPSEFIPPGVRKEIKEVNTHFRHIRGEPELLHDITCDGVSPVLEVKVESSSSPMVVSLEESGSMSLEEKDLSSSHDTHSEPSGDNPILKPIVEKAFKEVFRKDFSDFKKEMVSRSKRNGKVLASRLKKSAKNVRSCQSVNEDEEEGGGPCLVEMDREVDSIHEQTTLECQTDMVAERSMEEIQGTRPPAIDDSVWHSSFNISKFTQEKSKTSRTKSPKHLDVQMSQTNQTSVAGHESGELSFKGKIVPSLTEDSAVDFFCNEKERSPIFDGKRFRPSHSVDDSLSICRVTSSCVQNADQDTDSEQPCQLSAPHIVRNTKDVLNSPEPDSTSYPMVYQGHLVSSSANYRNSQSDRVVEDVALVHQETKSNSPDSPSKSLARFSSVSKTRRRAKGSRHNQGPASDSGNLQHLKEIHSDLYISSSGESEEGAESGDALNATFVISKERDGNVSDDAATPRSRCGFGGGENRGDRNITMTGWVDEVSLMESNSLSEFDRDVIIDQHRQIRAARGSSRTASISSHLSVGTFSPLSVSSVKLTPAHASSPKGTIWSPLNRTGDSQDLCHEDVRTPVSEGPCDGNSSGWLFGGAMEHMACQQLDTTEHVACQQLSRLLTLQELQRLNLVKTSFVLPCSSSNRSSESEDGSDSSSSEDTDGSFDSEREECHTTPIKAKTKTFDDTMASPLNRCLLSRLAESPGSPRRLSQRSPSVKCTMLEKVVISPRRSPRIKVQSPANTSAYKLRGQLSKVVPSSHTDDSPQGGVKSPGKKARKCVFEEMTGEEEDCPRRSVKIVEEKSACEHIVVGSCSATKNDRNLYPRRGRGHGVTGEGQGVTGGSQGVEEVTSGAVEVKCSVIDCRSESESERSSESGRRPLSLQEENGPDPLVLSSCAEFVDNVNRVSRRLDLDKAKMVDDEVRAGQSQMVDEEVVRVDQGVEGTVTAGEVACGTGEDGNFVCVDVEDGEIVDDDEEKEKAKDRELDAENVVKDVSISKGEKGCSVHHKSTSHLHKSRPNLPKSAPHASKSKLNLSDNSLLHITQDGCELIPIPATKTMTAKRGKNFVCRKDTNHSVSPMARIYTPPSTNTSKPFLRGNASKRLRSLSPKGPGRKPAKICCADRPSSNLETRHTDRKLGDGRRTDRNRPSSPEGSRRERNGRSQTSSRRRSPHSNRDRRRPVSSRTRHKSPVESRDGRRPRSDNLTIGSPSRGSDRRQYPKNRHISPRRECPGERTKEKCGGGSTSHRACEGDLRQRLRSDHRDKKSSQHEDRVCAQSVWADRVTRRRDGKSSEGQSSHSCVHLGRANSQSHESHWSDDPSCAGQGSAESEFSS